MKREVVVFLVLGSVVISLLEAPSALLSVTRAWNGPYPECRAQGPETPPVTIPAVFGPSASSFEPVNHDSFRAMTPALFFPERTFSRIPAVYRRSS